MAKKTKGQPSKTELILCEFEKGNLSPKEVALAVPGISAQYASTVKSSRWDSKKNCRRQSKRGPGRPSQATRKRKVKSLDVELDRLDRMFTLAIELYGREVTQEQIVGLAAQSFRLIERIRQARPAS